MVELTGISLFIGFLGFIAFLSIFQLAHWIDETNKRVDHLERTLVDYISKEKE
jgi:hypothetical protein